MPFQSGNGRINPGVAVDLKSRSSSAESVRVIVRSCGSEVEGIRKAAYPSA
jgi:hypothetical protein